MGNVVIGMDPHKRSATIEIIGAGEEVVAAGRFGTDRDGYRQLLAVGRRWPDRVWAVEGCEGVGRHLAQRLVADGESVVDVPAKLSARVRVFSTGHGRKTDATDAHSVAIAALRAPSLRAVSADDLSVALRLMVDRRDDLGAARTTTVNRLHRLLTELIPGGAKKSLSAQQARALLASVRPRDVVGKTRRHLAAELIRELEGIDRRIKSADRQLTKVVQQTGSTLMDLTGIGPSGASRLLGDIGDVSRFATRGHFASWNGPAPIDASSGDQNRHRLSRAGNRRINRVLHIMAIAQLRYDTPGRAYYRSKIAAGKTTMEAMRALKRRLSDVVYRRLVADQKKHRQTQREGGPGRTNGAAADSGAVDSNPNVDTSDTSHPEPANDDATAAATTTLPRSSTRSGRPYPAPARSRGQAQSA